MKVKALLWLAFGIQRDWDLAKNFFCWKNYCAIQKQHVVDSDRKKRNVIQLQKTEELNTTKNNPAHTC